MRVAVGVATKGRPEVVSALLRTLDAQDRSPDKVFVCGSEESDLPGSDAPPQRFELDVFTGHVGSCAQRNCIIEKARDFDLLIFFDDDFFPAPDFVGRAEHHFENNTGLVVLEGIMAVDGSVGRGFEIEEGLDHLRSLSSAADRPTPAPLQTIGSCRAGLTAVRLAPVFELGVRFDENLPLYGWQEDVDFSRSLLQAGRLARASDLTGVHLGIKRARTSGFRLGYSQIANPVYLMRKGTMPALFGLRLIVRALGANTSKLVFFERYIDRAGRLKGNVVALWHLLSGRLDPRYILLRDK